MWQAGIAAFLTAGMIGSLAVMQVAGAFPEQQIRHLDAVVVGTLVLEDSPRSALFTVENMAPGDHAIRALRVRNAGSLALRYAMSPGESFATQDLDTRFAVTVREPVAGVCAADAGAVIAGPGPLADAAFGSLAPGAQPGDRELAAGASEVLCFDVTLPLDASNALAGASADLTFVFHAEEARAE